MKIKLRIWLILLCFSIYPGWQSSAVVYAQNEAAGQHPAGAAAKTPEKSHDEEDINEFRHASNVQSIARLLHLDVETTAQIFEWVNSGILIFAVLFLLLKVVPKAMRGRSETIQKKLDEARLATAGATERLGAIEAKLARIGEDIDGLRKQSKNAMAEDEKRIKQSLEDERQRIVKAAEQEIESAGAAAMRDLKRFAAELAVESATKRIELSYESDKAIVERFGQELAGQFSKGAQN